MGLLMAGPSVTGVITLVIIINKIIFCLIIPLDHQG